MTNEAKQAVLSLRRDSQIAYLSSVDNQGYPEVRAMLVLEHESAAVQYFSTNTSSPKVAWFKQNPKASVYYCTPDSFRGALFLGDIQVCEDQPTKDLLWREGFERYYPKGVTDPDYCVLKLTVQRGEYYGPDRCRFTIGELG